jgi:FKBP-type peptidyl-prolyl cis-trans isomerase SlyD
VTPTTIGADCVVKFHYTLTLEDGTVADSSDGGEPLEYLHGHDGIVPGLERQLAGKKAGDELQAVVPPGEGYGEYDPQAEQEVPRSAFPKGMELSPGMQFVTETRHGGQQPIWIKAVQAEAVTVTQNHPLAGRTLHFKVKVVSMRKASKEELQHGHAHGPGGHHHH